MTKPKMKQIKMSGHMRVVRGSAVPVRLRKAGGKSKKKKGY